VYAAVEKLYVSFAIGKMEIHFFPSLLNYTKISLQKLFAFRYFSLRAVLTLLHSARLPYESPVLCSAMYNRPTLIINQTFKISRILLVFAID